MLRRYQHLVSEGMVVMPLWEDGIGKLKLGSGYTQGGPHFLDAEEEFPQATHEEFEKCCHLFTASISKLRDLFPPEEEG